jgi:hypothetical protein
MVGGAMERPVVILLDIWETLVPCMMILRIVHAHDVHNHLIDDLGLAINLGWKEVGFVSLVSNKDHRIDQKVLRNLFSWSEMMVCGIPKWTQMHFKKSLAISIVVEFFLQAVRMTIFENRSTTTNTQSFQCLVDEKPDM